MLGRGVLGGRGFWGRGVGGSVLGLLWGYRGLG